ncbi:MAG TPA: hypothetical protein VK752_21200 [Bryobacteraceae bacterium]|jgi:hypothetical protein|nr:hypothetical protein [Bryobacteraceae bacterium]
MRNVVMAAMLVAAGVSSSYVNRTGGSDNATEAMAKGKTPLMEGALPQPIDDPLDLLKNFLDPTYDPPPTQIETCQDPIDGLRELLNSKSRPCVAQEVRNPKKDAPGLNCKANREFKDAPLNLSFIIATIPDPERTHLSLYFDRALETIINAAEDQGFSYDRYWLPWHVNHDQANPDPRKQDILDGRAEARHRKPGVIILRRRPPAQDKPKVAVDIETAMKEGQKESKRRLQVSKNWALVIFLVGETPTAGINRYQFQRAADYVRSFEDCGYALGVLGPTFSGSFTSLRAALQRFPNGDQGSLVISGSASGVNSADGLGSSTVHSDVFLWTALKTFLARQLRITGEVVYLREATTDFGITSFDIYRPPNSPSSDIYYPREISRLRNVYPEQTNSAAAQVANLQQQLSLRLRDSRLGEETLPQFSDQTPLTQETVLLQISETLRRDHVGLVVVTGTDVLDVLFLSRHLRELSPDVRLLIWDSDLLLVHGTDTLDFSGMLTLSTYPLIPANHAWTNRDLPYLYFASNMTQGVYNACVLLLSGADATHPPNVREFFAPLVSPGNIVSPKPEWPPAWLSIIGHDAYWPLGFVEDTGMDSMPGVSGDESSSLDPGRPTRAWSSLFYFCSLLAFLYVGVYFYVLCQPLDSLPRWCSFLHPSPHIPSNPPGSKLRWRAFVRADADAPTPWRPGYSILMTFFLAAASLSFVVPVFRLVFPTPHKEWVFMLVVGIFCMAGFLTALVRGLAFLSAWVVIPAAGFGCAVAAYFIKFLIAFRTEGFLNEETFFRALRSVQIGSGVGPDLPLFFLFLALAWWASIQIQRARMVVEQQPRIPDIAANSAATNLANLNKWLRQPFLHIDGFGWVVAAGGASVAAAVAIPHVISVDGLLFDSAVCALLIPLSTLLFLTAYGFARIWRALDRFLGALETQPIRFAFSNLPSDVSWSPLWQYGTRKKTYSTLVRSLESLRALRECASEYYPTLAGDISSLDDAVKKILTSVNQGIEEKIADVDAAQDVLYRIAERLSNAQRTKDWKLNHSESLEKLRKASADKIVHKGVASWFLWGKPSKVEITSAPEDTDPCDKPEMLAAEVIALRYLAYIRYVIRHLRNLLSFITTGFILMTLALNCYPFQMLNLIRWSITIVFALIAAVLVYAFQEMSRNEILSRITDTKAGSLDAGFYTRVISVGTLPVLAVVASHFPSVGRFLFSWVQPAISALH